MAPSKTFPFYFRAHRGDDFPPPEFQLENGVTIKQSDTAEVEFVNYTKARPANERTEIPVFKILQSADYSLGLKHAEQLLADDCFKLAPDQLADKLLKLQNVLARTATLMSALEDGYETVSICPRLISPHDPASNGRLTAFPIHRVDANIDLMKTHNYPKRLIDGQIALKKIFEELASRAQPFRVDPVIYVSEGLRKGEFSDDVRESILALNIIGCMPQHRRERMVSFCETLLKKMNDGTPVESITAFVLSELSELHLLQNGNGRAARVIANMVLLEKNKPAVIWNPDSDAYCDTINRSRTNPELLAQYCRKLIAAHEHVTQKAKLSAGSALHFVNGQGFEIVPKDIVDTNNSIDAGVIAAAQAIYQQEDQWNAYENLLSDYRKQKGLTSSWPHFVRKNQNDPSVSLTVKEASTVRYNQDVLAKTVTEFQKKLKLHA